MRFALNPFTDKLDVSGLGPNGTVTEYLTGNDGIPVPSDSSYNINLLGENATGINTTGNAGTFTMTIHGLASSTTQVGTTRYATNAESAAQSSSTTALTPSNITSLFSTNPLPASQGGTGRASPAAHSLLVTNGSSAFTILGTASNGQIPIGSIGSDPVLANITSTGGTITITNGPGSINLETATTGVNWQTISASQTLVDNNGYICTAGGDLTLTLPATSSVGNEIFVTLDGSTSFTIAQRAGQQIRLGNSTTTAGIGGSLASTQQGDSLHLVCSVANLKWNVISSMGNPTIA